MKKIFKLTLLTFIVFIIVGCTKKETNLDGKLTDIMKELYKGINEEDVLELEQTKVTKKNQSYYLGDVTFEYKEALASEPLMSSVAHSVVLVRLKSSNDAEKAKKEIKEKVDPAKWICVSVEDKNVLVESKGDLVLLVMDNEVASKIKDNFLNLDNSK